MSTAHNGNDYERLKAELRRLKRRSAPWYFESALHQRLHGARKGRPRLRPISTTPVLVVACITLCLLGLAVYVVLVHTNLLIPRSQPVVVAPFDTLSRALPVDTLLSSSQRGSAAVKGSPPGGARPPAQARSGDDTSRVVSRVRRAVIGDTVAARPDTLLPQRDSSWHGPDTTVSPGPERDLK